MKFKLLLTVVTIVMLYASCKPNNDLTVKYELVVLPGSIFDLDVKVLITDDTAFAANYVRANLDSTVTSKHFNARAATFPTQDGKPIIIWMPYGTHIDIINHELFHATFNIMEWAGVPLNDTTEEVYAYQLQYLSNQLDNQINITK